MDATRFDRITRSLASRMSRRRAVQTLGGAGLGAAVSVTQRNPHPLSAQSDDGDCTLDLTAGVRFGPSAGTTFGDSIPGELTGRLGFSIRSAGEFSNAEFALADGTRLAATGTSDGLALTVRIDIPLVGTLVLVGAGEDRIPNCSGTADGLFTGPLPGDIGDWHGVLSGPGASAAGSQLTAGSQPTPDQTRTASATAGQSPTATATATSTEAGPSCIAFFQGCNAGGLPCCNGSNCFSGVCLFPDGASCSVGFDCAGGYCSGGRCASCTPDDATGCAATPCCTPSIPCINNTCQDPCAAGAQGFACAGYWCCPPAYCDPSIGPCAPCKEAGSTCGSLVECCPPAICRPDTKVCTVLTG